jgi:hypothetical protein
MPNMNTNKLMQTKNIPKLVPVRPKLVKETVSIDKAK